MKSFNNLTPTKSVGVGLRSFHFDYILKNLKKISSKIGWFEVHSENYFAKGGSSLNTLLEIRKNFPLSLHSVGNSLGSSQKISLEFLKKLKDLIEKTEPFIVSDHISWGRIDDKHYNDLLPLPYTKKSLKAISINVATTQDFLKRQILVENPSAYLAYENQEYEEADFINELAKITGCGLLLDVNNIYVSSQNNNEFDPKNYLKKLNKKIVKEIHLAGHMKSKIFDGKKNIEVLIDTHNDLVCDEVWDLYKIAIKTFGEINTLLEWDQDFPEFNVLLDEAKRADKIIKEMN